MLSGFGPQIPMKFASSGIVETKVRSEFESAGINQTIHRIYLDVVCEVSVLTPYNVMEENIKNEVVLVENVIVGIVPTTYYNLEGMTTDGALEVIE